VGSFRLLAISGSLRTHSVNTAVLRTAAQVAPAHVEVLLYEGLGQLPHFNPDLDGPESPAAVAEFRRQVAGAHGVLICSPEYAHGIPGTLKNALDWLVSYEPFSEKRIGILNARPRATFAIAALRETLRTMNAQIVEAACIALPLDNNRQDETSLLANREVVALLRTAIDAMREPAKL
jgi:NAD(P)H-dependent FMN reductase